MSDCLFCNIVEGAIPSTKVYEDEHVLAFRDIQPIAPAHVLVIPKRHIANILDLATDDTGLYQWLIKGIREVAQSEGIAESGFRVIANTGQEGQQSVGHLHFHVIGGRQLEWKM